MYLSVDSEPFILKETVTCERSKFLRIIFLLWCLTAWLNLCLSYICHITCASRLVDKAYEFYALEKTTTHKPSVIHRRGLTEKYRVGIKKKSAVCGVVCCTGNTSQCTRHRQETLHTQTGPQHPYVTHPALDNIK